MKRASGWVLLTGAVLGLMVYCGLHIVFNVTPSLPVGFYWRVVHADLQPGQLVELSLPDAVVPLVRANAQSLLKRVAGIEGDQVRVVGDHPQSVDSRMFGPVHIRRVLYRVVPLWTWETRHGE